MAVSRVRVNRRGARDILRSAEVAAELERRGRAIARRAGGAEKGFEVQTWTGRNRARVTVRTATPAAMAREAKDRRLSRALDAGR